jgi:hypothetical protein
LSPFVDRFGQYIHLERVIKTTNKHTKNEQMADIENPYQFRKDDLLTGVVLSALVVIVVAGYALIAPSEKSKAKEAERQRGQQQQAKTGKPFFLSFFLSFFIL